MSKTIVFYDIPSKLPINACSPNTWKARYALNFKGLPYRTEWIEFPDIEALYKRLGVSASATHWSDGVTPYYSLPLIHDLSTGAIVSDSAAIAEYLDVTYPDTPRLFPPGTQALHAAFTVAFHAQLLKAITPLLVPAANAVLNPRSEVFFRKTREKAFGMTLEDMDPRGECREKQWALVERDLGEVDKWIAKGDAFVTGNVPTFADITVCGWMLSFRIIFGEDSPEWRDLSTWHDGRWGRLVRSFEKYEVVV
ncbi:uncharacterized protein EV420DRAFT_1549514 [Desarmillaria tabescens]|uniref:GST N-terminal domain-containing protein n=1 Tax=Armillaria tabescens TaxID=1929756 RepID=A0AA39K9V0_ARMTA|nr:uncharacterized protein EV420DRAFT_1549514 [Desarmillaria tabescens]KAK0457237.1 hypothetical protein EV420DRAFT_1549514 [Desarmillaria tabescens]